MYSQSEAQDVSDSASNTRDPSPDIPQASAPLQPSELASLNTPVAFPLNAGVVRISTRQLLSYLPQRDEAWVLVEAYYRYCAWQ
jgi:hypothetical protein